MAWGAGRKDWYLIRSLSDLDRVIGRGSTSDCLTVFAGRQLPFRGPAGEDLLSRALEVVARFDESLFGELAGEDVELKDVVVAEPGNGQSVQEWMLDRLGHHIAFGPYPPFHSDDPELAIDGIIPANDGTVTVAAY